MPIVVQATVFVVRDPDRKRVSRIHPYQRIITNIRQW
ncbi:hypothetical protein DRB17_05610 [Ferruginivarius sediminum]|uniref:Uncharacterized protein n=1 Tax=Ferruginivarius sediminum TaxID=2661937 RepID=A0A369TEB1_9PROT|nr:hypothetical protein DRB17_05610 [Ferruginivarius sediminum]